MLLLDLRNLSADRGSADRSSHAECAISDPMLLPTMMLCVHPVLRKLVIWKLSVACLFVSLEMPGWAWLCNFFFVVCFLFTLIVCGICGEVYVELYVVVVEPLERLASVFVSHSIVRTTRKARRKSVVRQLGFLVLVYYVVNRRTKRHLLCCR